MPTGRTSSRCGSTLSVSSGGFWGVPQPRRVVSHSRNWSRCWAGSGIPPASLGPVLPGSPSAGGWDMAIKDLERRGWVVESPRVGVMGWGHRGVPRQGSVTMPGVPHRAGNTVPWSGTVPWWAVPWQGSVTVLGVPWVSHRAVGHVLRPVCHTYSAVPRCAMP